MFRRLLSAPLGYLGRASSRLAGWRGDAFVRFRWWDWPAALWFAMFGRE